MAINNSNLPRKILIIFLSGIGNFILFTPTLRAIRSKFPDAEITLLLKHKVVTDIIAGKSLVDKIIYYPQTASFFALVFLTNKLRNKYDIVVTTFEAQGWKLAFFVRMIAGGFSIGYRTGKLYDRFYTKILVKSPGIHEIDRHLEIAHILGADVTDKNPEITVMEKDRKFAETIILRTDKPGIGMHPGSSEFLLRKRWMPERFAEVADKLSRNYDAKIFIFGGADEVQLAEKISGLMQSKAVIMAGKTTLGQAAALIEKCTLFVSNDSGLMHIAAAVGTPTIAVFGPTDSVKNPPFGEGHTVVRKDLPCSPCLYFGKDGCKSPECLDAITVEDVVDAVENKLGLLDFLKNE
jgi:lipopolysaccharide heptosyltransferase II